MKLLVTTKQVTVILFKVKLSIALLRMLLAFIGIYNQVLTYKFLILDTCHPDTACT